MKIFIFECFSCYQKLNEQKNIYQTETKVETETEDKNEIKPTYESDYNDGDVRIQIPGLFVAPGWVLHQRVDDLTYEGSPAEEETHNYKPSCYAGVTHAFRCAWRESILFI